MGDSRTKNKEKYETRSKKTVSSCHPWFSLPSASHVQSAPKLINCIILCLESIPDPISLPEGGQVLSSFLDLAIGLLPDLAGFAASLFQSVIHMAPARCISQSHSSGFQTSQYQSSNAHRAVMWKKGKTDYSERR